MPLSLLLLLLLISLSYTAAAVAGGQPPPPPTTILASLGFTRLAAAADLPLCPFSTWVGPTTVFAPSDSSLLTCPSCSVPLIFGEHTVPGLYTLGHLRTLAFGTKIETLASGRCLTITSEFRKEINSSKVFVGGVEITRPDLYTSQNVVVHGLQGFITHLSPLSCHVERGTSLSFPALPLPSTSSFYITRVMLKDAMLRLRISGFSLLSLALKVHYNDLLDLQAMTLFAVDDDSIFSSNEGNRYVSNLKLHIVPNRRLMAADLEGLPAGTVMPTMEWGERVVVTTSGGGGALDPVRINYVKVTRPDLVFNMKVAVHGVEVGLKRVNLTAAVGLAKRVGQCEWERDGMCDVARVGAAPGAAPSAGIEDRHDHGYEI